jgi:hypothetical protein
MRIKRSEDWVWMMGVTLLLVHLLRASHLVLGADCEMNEITRTDICLCATDADDDINYHSIVAPLSQM